jgi:DNA-binding XRE family transcriptional regulator
MSFKNYNPSLFAMKRVICNISAEELGKRCFLTKQTIRNIETGKTTNKSNILLIGLTLDDLAQELDVLDQFNALENQYNAISQVAPLIQALAFNVKK